MESQVNMNLLKKVKENIIGNNTVIVGPFGPKQQLYCDYTASGKALEYIEKFIYNNVYPYYANSHTTTSISGLQTTMYREESRDFIHKAVNAKNEDVVIFTGSGSTAAIHKIISVLDLRPPKTDHTVVIIGPYEHHSNILPWKETGVHMERVLEDDDGTVSLSDLERHLRYYFHRGFCIIVTMSAASNVTGIVSDTDTITRLVHKYGGLAFWDFATAAPYLPIDMNPALDCSKDAIFISPHKFIGGVGTPGVLIAKKKLFNNPVPDKCGGGTVSWVSQQNHEYLNNITEKEEGGTPAIVESIRAGLAFQVKSLIGAEVIMHREEELCHRALHRWRGNPCLQLLGSYSATRLPIFSFLVYQPTLGKYLHHNFISVLLNDLYGIQVRGGCACAGPYAQDLLEMEEEDAMLFVHSFLSENRRDLGKEVLNVMKPGFVRLNFPYFLDDECVEFILTAIETVAREGWKLLPLYVFDKDTGNWKHRKGSKHQFGHLKDATLGIELDTAETDSVSKTVSRPATKISKKQLTYKVILKDVQKILNNYQYLAEEDPATEPLTFDADTPSLMWFLQPHEVREFILMPELPPSPPAPLPFRPRRRSSTYRHPPLAFTPVITSTDETVDGCPDDCNETREEISDQNVDRYPSDCNQTIELAIQEASSKDQQDSTGLDKQTLNDIGEQDSKANQQMNNETSKQITNETSEQVRTGPSHQYFNEISKEASPGTSHQCCNDLHLQDNHFKQDNTHRMFSHEESSYTLSKHETVKHNPENSSDSSSSDENTHSMEDSAYGSPAKLLSYLAGSPVKTDKHQSYQSTVNTDMSHYKKDSAALVNSPVCNPYSLFLGNPLKSPIKFPESPLNLSPLSDRELVKKCYDKKGLPPIKNLVKSLNNETTGKVNNEDVKVKNDKGCTDDDCSLKLSLKSSTEDFEIVSDLKESDGGKRSKRGGKKISKKKKDMCVVM